MFWDIFGFRWGREIRGKNGFQRKKSCLDLCEHKMVLLTSLQLRIANYTDSTRISWIIIYYFKWMIGLRQKITHAMRMCILSTCLNDYAWYSLKIRLKNLQRTESFSQRGTFKSISLWNMYLLRKMWMQMTLLLFWKKIFSRVLISK